MKTVEIKHRFTGAVLFTAQVEEDDAYPIRTALKQAIATRAYLARAYLARADLAGANLAHADLAGAYLARAYLARADLAGANLARANLARANLADANLADAYLADANLARANLARANLADADLARANLADADLAGANLARANLADADLARANLADADLARAYLAGAYLAGADLARANLADADLARAKNVPAGTDPTATPTKPYERKVLPRAQRLAEHARLFRERNPDVPVVEQLDKKILEIVETGRGVLNMSDWHHGDACGTTHCRAGWAIHLAGPQGAELEKQYGPERAGSMIYRASTGRAPYFFGSDSSALADIKRCAAEQTEAQPEQPEQP